jgi:hypothetical protein
MIDRLQAVASRVQPLRFVAIAVGLFCLGVTMFIVFSPPSYEGDRFLIPSLIGLLWSVSAYNFLVIFGSVPEKAAPSDKRFKRFKRAAWRAWYWFIALVFAGTTLAMLVASNSLLSVWIQDYVD